MSDDSDPARDIALEAMRHEGSSRSEFVRQMTAGDLDLLGRVQALLVELSAADGIKGRATMQTPTSQVLKADIPKAIGDFSIRRVIGSGGMGTVYEAMQENPRRKVAIKVMKRGVTSSSALRRFQFESQVLARLHHPGIAQVYEAGTWDDGTGGVPFFVMEFIGGAKTLTAYVADKDLDTAGEVELFAQVCDAVHHGHQKGIIHRDLKPGNVLVDRQGNPKVIDFGVARSTDSDLAVTTQQTDVGALVGTLQYMSPEQCEADPDIIDTRSDVYALGVMLYEMLCGKQPYDLSSMAIFDAAKAVREQSPTRLSVVNPVLRGDLETIVAKAMAKDPDYRYQSALELRQDLERYLKGEPISARPLSLSYQVSLMARRNKAAVVAAAVIAAVLVVATAVSIVLAVNASIAEDRALTAQVQTEAALVKAGAQQEFLEDVLGMTSPRNAQGRELDMQQVLIEAADGIEGQFVGHPELAAETRVMIGEVMHDLQMFEEADAQLAAGVALLEELAGPQDPRVLRAMAIRSRTLAEVGRAAEADEVSREMIDRVSGAFDDTDPVMIEVFGARTLALEFLTRYEEASAMSERWLAASRGLHGDRHETTIEAMAVHGRMLMHRSAMLQDETRQRSMQESGYEHLAEAAHVAREELGERHPITVQALAMQAYIDMFRLLVEDRLYQPETYHAAVEDLQLVLGDDHTAVLDHLHQHGRGLMFVAGGRNDQDLMARSRELLERALAGYLRSVGATHPLSRAVEVDLAQLEGMTTGVMTTESLRASYEHLLEIHDEDHLNVLRARALLAIALLLDGQLDEGLPLMDRSIDQMQGLLGPNHMEIVRMLLMRTEALFDGGRIDEGLADAEDALARMDADREQGALPVLKVKIALANLYGKADRIDLAYALMIDVVEEARTHLTPESRTRARAISALAHIQLERGEPAEALVLIEEASAGHANRPDPDEDLLVVMALLRMDTLSVLGRGDEATALREHVLASAGASFPQAQRVATLLLGLERPTMIEAAGPALLEVLISTRDAAEPEQGEAAELIASLHAALGAFDEAVHWQEQAMLAATPEELESLRDVLDDYRTRRVESTP